MKQLTLTYCIKHERHQRISKLVQRINESGVPEMMNWKYSDVVRTAKRAVERGIAKRYYS